MDAYKINDIETLVSKDAYLGRGIVLGMSGDAKKAVAAYFISGRSENSRNRVFLEKNDGVEIRPFDLSKVTDPSLIIYSPVKTVKNNIVVTNGDQTDTICDFINSGKSFEEALSTRFFEPDAPNFTPRISGIMTFEKSKYSYKLSILKSANDAGNGCNRFTYSYHPLAGLGHFIHTYAGDGDPLPAFAGEPACVSVPDNIDSFANNLWENLNSENKISLYVCYTEIESGKRETRLFNVH